MRCDTAYSDDAVVTDIIFAAKEEFGNGARDRAGGETTSDFSVWFCMKRYLLGFWSSHEILQRTHDPSKEKLENIDDQFFQDIAFYCAFFHLSSEDWVWVLAQKTLR
ncbi:Uncharacterized protein Rs2_09756 [Raphanus sativus]|nr:Uncharacterized protein Rs2_09756 [Raphanus sativus]